MKHFRIPAIILAILLLALLLAGCENRTQGTETAGTAFSPVPVWKFCHGLQEGLDTAVITGYQSDCEEGLLPVQMTPEETESIRRLAMNGTVLRKANDLAVTGGTWVYSFETPEGKHLLTVELYKGLIVGSDGMYEYETTQRSNTDE